MSGDFPVRRILLDCTDTSRSTVNTGIQRVVRNLARHAPAAAAAVGVECALVAGDRLGFVEVSCRPRPGTWGLPADESGPSAVTRWRRAAATRLRKALVPRTVCRPLTTLAARWLGPTTPSDGRVVPGPGDALVLLDMRLWPDLAAARARGAVVGQLIYDLLPVDHPEWFRPGVAAGFRRWLRRAVATADFIVTISEATTARVERYLWESGVDRPLPIRSFRLGCTLDTDTGRADVRPEVRAALGGSARGTAYLTVGTLEPRKNHRLILDAFDRGWVGAPDARLCLVGRAGWLCDDLIRRVREHPRYGRSLHLWTDLRDTELDYCYRHARALIFASQDEGFGLPIAEALRYGIRVMASDIPVHREVGRDCCAYFSLGSPDGLARLVLDLEMTGRFPAVRPPTPADLLHWAASGREFVGGCLAAARAVAGAAIRPIAA